MRHFITVLLILVALACGESSTGPTEPAEPTGKLLVFDQIASVYVVDLATGESREVSLDGEPFAWVSPVFDEGANVVMWQHRSREALPGCSSARSCIGGHNHPG